MPSQHLDLQFMNIIGADDVMINYELSSRDRRFLRELGVREQNYYSFSSLVLPEHDDWFLRNMGSVSALAGYMEKSERKGFRMRMGYYTSILRDIRSDAPREARRSIKEHTNLLHMFGSRNQLIPAYLARGLAKETNL